MKSYNVILTDKERMALMHIAEEAADGWGEPFKDLDVEWDPDDALDSAIRRLRRARRVIGPGKD